MPDIDPAKFWAKVKRGADSECWLWQGALTDRGYGFLWQGVKARRAHRIAWQIENGRAVPAGMVVMHSCDVRRCCNPAHLSVGTDLENIADRTRKGRTRGFKPGKGYQFQRLTEDQAREIWRLSGLSVGAISRTISVPQTTIRDVLARRTWAHI